MPKRVWQPKKVKRARKHGFLTRSKSAGGRKVLKRRILKGRQKLTVTK
ncbi:50S ribosomal protein L34 [Candidatus Gottesmanbacteria bacterium]|nr:50S ribosomal protein L34 [Candidatus Gottesmanbacteria bacterium]